MNKPELTPKMAGVVERMARAGHPPLDQLTPEAAEDVIVMTVEADGTGALYPVVYCRRDGRLEEHPLPGHPLLDFATREHADALQQLLLRQDASIFGVANHDPLDLAPHAKVTASSTLGTLDPAAGWPLAEERRHRLDSDLGIVVPVDPVLDSVSVLITTSIDTELVVSLWTTGQLQNAVPVTVEPAAKVVAAEPDHRDLEIGAAEPPRLHDSIVRAVTQRKRRGRARARDHARRGRPRR